MTQIDTHPAADRKPRDKELVPRTMARAMLILCLTVLAVVTWARVTDRPLSATPPAGEIVRERAIVLSGNMAGRATVTAPDGTLIADLTPEEGGFISGVYRVIQRERTKHRVTTNAPLALRQRDTGRLEIHDPATGWSADLMGFGADNAKAFARLLAN